MPTPGWYPDPLDSRAVRYWDGSEWTSQQRHLVANKGSDDNSATSGHSSIRSWLTRSRLIAAVLLGAIVVGGVAVLLTMSGDESDEVAVNFVGEDGEPTESSTVGGTFTIDEPARVPMEVHEPAVIAIAALPRWSDIEARVVGENGHVYDMPGGDWALEAFTESPVSDDPAALIVLEPGMYHVEISALESDWFASTSNYLIEMEWSQHVVRPGEPTEVQIPSGAGHGIPAYIDAPPGRYSLSVLSNQGDTSPGFYLTYPQGSDTFELDDLSDGVERTSTDDVVVEELFVTSEAPLMVVTDLTNTGGTSTIVLEPL